MDDAAAVSDVFDDRPELEDPMEAVLAVDDEHDEWTFDDLPIDSGAFGELVSRGFVEQTESGDGYRVADPAAVRAALDGESTGDVTDGDASVDVSLPGRDAISDRLAGVDRLQVGALLATLLAVVLARAYVYPSVFHDGAVILSGNDPYYYRYWVEQALGASGGMLDVSSLATMSETVQTGEPLLVATLWVFSSLFGGDATAAGWVLAWYPVVAAVITAYLVYLLAMRVTDDRRVALAAVLLLAVTPAHAFRTSLGFADHHAFDYVWLMVTAYALLRLNSETTVDWWARQQWAWAIVLGFGVGGQILAWEAGPLLLVPLAVYVAARVLQDVRSERRPLLAGLPLLGGIGFGAALVYIGHVGIGWHSATVAFSPVILTLGTLGVLGLGELAHRYEVSVSLLTPAEVAGAVAGLIILRTLRPDYWSELMAGIGRIVASRDIAETQSLLSGDTVGWLFLFGFVLVLAVPFLVWASIDIYRGKGNWLVPVIYCWYFVALAMFQVRFAGQLAMFASVFAGLGFVYLAAAVDLIETHVPFDEVQDVRTVSLPARGKIGSLVVLFLLVGGLSMVQTPLKTGQVTTDGEKYRAAVWIDEYAETQEWEYPENYVFSRWGENRMYNYFVNGRSRSYQYAQTHYETFVRATDHRVAAAIVAEQGSFVVTDATVNTGRETVYTRLHDHYGSYQGGVSGVPNFRALYTSESGDVKVFTTVTGALLTGRASPNTTVTVSTDVTVQSSQFVYQRRVETSESGLFGVVVPYAGTYTVGASTVTVPESAVQKGDVTGGFDGQGPYVWSFDDGTGETAYDTRSGNHAMLTSTRRVPGQVGTGIEFDDSGHGRARVLANGTDEFTVVAWIRPESNQSGAILSTGKDGKSPNQRPVGFLFDHGQAGFHPDRLGLYLGNGTDQATVFSQTLGLAYPRDQYVQVAVVFDEGTVTFYKNGAKLGRRNVDMTRITFDRDRPLYIGRQYSENGGLDTFSGGIDQLWYARRALSAEAVRDQYANATTGD